MTPPYLGPVVEVVVVVVVALVVVPVVGWVVLVVAGVVVLPLQLITKRDRTNRVAMRMGTSLFIFSSYTYLELSP
jgi:hypothetical protein